MTAAIRRLLMDTGPLVVGLDAEDPHHRLVSQFLGSYEGELLTTWPVLTETCHLLPETLVPTFMRWVGGGGLTIA
jgi:predicted nucleic acid-binding protein